MLFVLQHSRRLFTTRQINQRRHYENNPAVRHPHTHSPPQKRLTRPATTDRQADRETETERQKDIE